MKKFLIFTASAVLIGLLCACDGNAAAEDENNIEDTTNEAITEITTESTTETTTQAVPSHSNAESLDNTTYGWYYMAQGNHLQPLPPNEHDIDFSEYLAYYTGNSEEKVIYLTFDEGYENGYTEQILNTLKEKDVTAAFFITGYFLEQRPDLVKRMVDEGHIVGSHSVNHYSSPDLSEEEFNDEINVLADNYKAVTGEKMPPYFRPPRGEYSERTLALANNLGYKNIFWSFAHQDWLVDEQPDEAETLNMIIESAHNGEIMLLHAVSKTNADVLSDVIDELKKEGYEFKGLDNLN